MQILLNSKLISTKFAWNQSKMEMIVTKVVR